MEERLGSGGNAFARQVVAERARSLGGVLRPHLHDARLDLGRHLMGAAGRRSCSRERRCRPRRTSAASGVPSGASPRSEARPRSRRDPRAPPGLPCGAVPRLPSSMSTIPALPRFADRFLVVCPLVHAGRSERTLRWAVPADAHSLRSHSQSLPGRQVRLGHGFRRAVPGSPATPAPATTATRRPRT